MLSGRLVQNIETHWEEIAARLIQKIRRHPETPALGALPDAQLRDWCQTILENLQSWLPSGGEEEIRRRYEAMGGDRFEESIPLHEAVLRLQLLKGAIIDFARQDAVPVTSVQIYAEQELEDRLGHFFDALVYYIVCGYEKAMRRAVRYA
jgi:hypothetical protein